MNQNKNGSTTTLFNLTFARHQLDRRKFVTAGAGCCDDELPDTHQILKGQSLSCTYLTDKLWSKSALQR